jgi:cytochrome c553
MYYRALGAVGGCTPDGKMIDPITFDDWKRARKFSPYTAGNTEVSAVYINKMDLNLVRRMTATQTGPNDISFFVCNNPGPETGSQREVDSTIDTALAAEKLVACVAMEWSATVGVNAGKPYTKFLTFGPDGSLLQSINLDGRGEKYIPGTCVACHGGTQYNGRFPEKGNPSAYLGAGFQAFDTANYFFGSAPGLNEAAQSDAIFRLNALVAATEPSGTTPVNRIFAGWYPNGSGKQNNGYVPPVWQAADVRTPGAAHLYREVIGQSCRTCHAAMGAKFDWDSIVLTPARASTHFCGGTSDLANNASMPNALVTRDRIAEKVRADPTLAALMTTFLGCSTPLPDPAYARK